MKIADENAPPLGVVGSPSIKAPPDLEIGSSPDLEEEPLGEESSCAICFARPRCVRNRPCGHAVSCGLCTILATNPPTKSYSCPTCRQQVEEIEWHGEAVPTRMATDGRALPAGTAVRSDLFGFLQARAANTSDAPLADASRRALSTWGVLPASASGEPSASAAPPEESFPLVAAAEAGDIGSIMRLLARGEVDVNLPDA